MDVWTILFEFIYITFYSLDVLLRGPAFNSFLGYWNEKYIVCFNLQILLFLLHLFLLETPKASVVSSVSGFFFLLDVLVVIMY